jgi:hypothetical protein
MDFSTFKQINSISFDEFKLKSRKIIQRYVSDDSLSDPWIIILQLHTTMEAGEHNLNQTDKVFDPITSQDPLNPEKN